jgi:hypothetical protein
VMFFSTSVERTVHSWHRGACAHVSFYPINLLSLFLATAEMSNILQTRVRSLFWCSVPPPPRR